MSTQTDPPAKKGRISRRTLILGLILVPLLCLCCFAAILINTAMRQGEPTTVVEVEEVATDEEIVEEPTATDQPSSASPTSVTDEPTNAPPPTATPEPTIAPTEPAPSATPLPQPTTEPQPTEATSSLPTPGELRELTAAELALQTTLDKALGESNRGLGRKLNLFDAAPPEFGEKAIIIGWAADTADSNSLIREGMARDTLTVLKAVVESGQDYDAVYIGSQYLMPIELLNITDELEVLTLTYSRNTLNAIDWNTITPGEIFQVADQFIIHPDFEE